MTESPESPDTRISIFQVNGGKVHRAKAHPWGIGTRCSDRFVYGASAEGLVSDVTCAHCQVDLGG